MAEIGSCVVQLTEGPSGWKAQVDHHRGMEGGIEGGELKATRSQRLLWGTDGTHQMGGLSLTGGVRSSSCVPVSCNHFEGHTVRTLPVPKGNGTPTGIMEPKLPGNPSPGKRGWTQIHSNRCTNPQNPQTNEQCETQSTENTCVKNTLGDFCQSEIVRMRQLPPRANGESVWAVGAKGGAQRSAHPSGGPGVDGFD